MPAIVNIHQAEAWNGYEGAYWAEHQDRYDAVSGGFNNALFAAAAIGEPDRVLDIGCSNGQTTRLAARRARYGHALGVDLSAPMLARARATAVTEGAGYLDVAQTPVKAPMQFGRDAADAASFMLSSGPFRFMLGQVDHVSAERASDAVRSAFRSHEGPDGVELSGVAWIVSAARP
jgi:SAM-dependent methyltransferase